ncbi:hypothetical protein ACJX0J_031631 [Zea mays]
MTNDQRIVKDDLRALHLHIKCSECNINNWLALLGLVGQIVWDLITLKLEAIRILLYQMDVKSAFPNGYINELIYNFLLLKVFKMGKKIGQSLFVHKIYFCEEFGDIMAHEEVYQGYIE